MAVKQDFVSKIEFNNFKAFDKFSAKFSKFDVIVGPNNSGKSTVLEALRILNSAWRSVQNKSPYYISKIRAHGYNITTKTIHVPFEYIQTDYTGETSIIRIYFRFKGSAVLTFTNDGFLYLHFLDKENKNLKTLNSIKSSINISIGLIPPLGTLEPAERLLTQKYITAARETHLSPRHFRNQWYYDKKDFRIFRELLKETWPEMDIALPELQTEGAKPTALELHSKEKPLIFMFCKEDRITREINWAGSGFQVWLQLLSHLIRNRDSTTIIVDEPEIYLHPDLQRRFIAVAKKIGPQLIVATHSVEVINESDFKDILVIDKRQQNAEKIKDVKAIRNVIEYLGSVQNIYLARLAHSKKILFVEGQDFKILSRLCKKLGLDKLAEEENITVVPLEGFSNWPRIIHAEWVFKNALGEDISASAILDRDFKSDEETEHIKNKLEKKISQAQFWRRKEIENYLLDFNAISSLIESKLIKKHKKMKMSTIQSKIIKFSEKTMEEEKGDILPLFQMARLDFNKTKGGKDKKLEPTVLKEALSEFEKLYSSLEGKIKICPGKTFLSKLFNFIQSEFNVTISIREVIEEMVVDDIPEDLKDVLTNIEIFRLKK